MNINKMSNNVIMLGVFIGWALITIILTMLFGPFTLFWEPIFKICGILGAIGFFMLLFDFKTERGEPMTATDILASILSYILGPITLFSVITLHLIKWKRWGK